MRRRAVTGDRPLSHIAFKTHRLEAGEEIKHTWVAGIPWSQKDSFAGRLSKLGGNLVLTDCRLMFEPLKAPKLGGGLKGLELEFLRGMKALPLDRIAEVERFSAKPPPRLRVRVRTGEQVVLAVMAKRSATIFSGDASARDEAVATISAALRP